MQRQQEALTWGVRLIVYSYIEDKPFFRKILPLSKRERKYLLGSSICGGRKCKITIDAKESDVVLKRRIQIPTETLSLLNEIHIDYTAERFSRSHGRFKPLGLLSQPKE